MSTAEVHARMASIQARFSMTPAAVAPAPAPAAEAAATFQALLAAQQASSATGGSLGSVGSLASLSSLTPPGSSWPTTVYPIPTAPLGGDMAARAATYRPAFDAAGARYGVEPDLLAAVAWTESGFDAGAVSHAGALGLMQIMPGTAATLGVDPRDPAQAIDGAARYLREQLDRFGGDVSLALAAYNAGPGAVERHGGIPPYPETTRYVTTVLGRLDTLRST